MVNLIKPCSVLCLCSSDSSPLFEISSFVHVVIWMQGDRRLGHFPLRQWSISLKYTITTLLPLPMVGGVCLLWQDLGCFLNMAHTSSFAVQAFEVFRSLQSQCLSLCVLRNKLCFFPWSILYDSGWCIHHLLSLCCNNKCADDGFYLLNPASLLHLSQRAGPISYGFHNAVLHSSSWHRLTA